MDVKSALEKEINTLDGYIRNSLEYAEKRNDVIIGSTTRFVYRQMIDSYSRVLKSLSE